MKTVYIETSVISYLTARPTRNHITAGNQEITREWWAQRRPLFHSVVSPVVEREAAKGDSEAASRRLAILCEFESLKLDDDAIEPAERLMKETGLPSAARDDALHIALAAVHGIDYLVTWNCRHIDNAEIKPIVRAVCAIQGYSCPEICTPAELMGDWNHER